MSGLCKKNDMTLLNHQIILSLKSSTFFGMYHLPASHVASGAFSLGRQVA